jgi:nitrate reductase gamma subunit
MYELARGPLVWVAFIVFFGGLGWRLVRTIKLAGKDKVVHPYISFKNGLRSLAHWLTPYAARNMRLRPTFTALSFAFHICILLLPLFVSGHVLLVEQSWDVSWWTVPDGIANALTILVVLVGVMFALRRIADPAVRFVTQPSDFVILAIVILPFVTGLLAYYQVFDYRTAVTLHMLSGELWLIIIPFTRLVHMMFFPLTRIYMGSEFGFVRNARDW